jgi:5-deoxy-glucuronate isomerase
VSKVNKGSLGTFVKRTGGVGAIKVVSPETSALEWLEFNLLRLNSGEEWEDEGMVRLSSGDEHGAEVAVVVLSGACSIYAGNASWEGLQCRRDVFSGKATALYVPPNARYRIIAKSSFEAAVVKVIVTDKNTGAKEPTLITPEQVKRRTVGFLNWQREIDDIIDASFPAARLLLGETRNPPGNWSSYPPHKHDINNPPYEVRLEEVYHYRIFPSHGFAVQLLYDDERQEVYVVGDGDTLAIARGYHPVVVAPGYRLYYLWALAGDERQMYVRFDESHSWVLAMEATIATK